MSELYLCSGDITSLPYYLETAGLNIYSIEELGYYLKENIDIIDESFMNKELIDWIRAEMSASVLVQKLEYALESENLYDYIESILNYAGIFEREEINDCIAIMKQYRNRNAFERRKIKADGYVKKELFYAAIREYEKVLKMDDVKSYPKEYIGEIYNNLGCAYVGMFMYKEAYDCFVTAFRYSNNEKCRLHAIRCEAYINSEASFDYEATVMSKEIEKLVDKEVDDFSDQSKLLDILKEDYRKLLNYSV